jgi:uncharacterized protein
MSASGQGSPSLIDHHAHQIILDELDRTAFEALLNEAAAPPRPHNTFFDSMLGMSLRRWCAPVLGLPPHASADAYLTRRAELGREASRRLVAGSGVTDILVDTGISDERLCSLADLGGLSGASTYRVTRLETLAEGLLAADVSSADLADRVVEALQTTDAVAAKSVAAYRVGLALPSRQPSGAEVREAARHLRPGPGGTWRIADPVLCGWLAWTAIKVGLPLQIHVGYGDTDLDLHRADPLLLTPFLRATEPSAVPIMLLHNYPFHRSAGYLAQAFGHVFCDVGLAVHNTGALSANVIRELLELAPFDKVLFSTDAYALAEHYYLGAVLFRRGLDRMLVELVGADEFTRADADRISAMIESENARRAYRL